MFIIFILKKSMEELRDTISEVLKKLLGKKVYKLQLAQKIREFFKNKGIKDEDYDVEVKRKYIYIRVGNSYIRQEMSFMSYALMEYLKREFGEIDDLELKFTGRPR